MEEDGTPVVAYLGPASSYTHQAALSALDPNHYEHRAQETIADVFDAVESGNAMFGVVPIENSTNGAVIPTLELLCDRNNFHANIMICGEAYLDVVHYLLGKKNPNIAVESPILSGTCTPTNAAPLPVKPRTVPLSDLKHIKKLYSHPQAWGQCDAFLAAFLKHAEKIDVSSTSRAAEMAAEDETGTSAAIASKLAAQVHGLDILAQAIEDKEDNKTRFFILRKGVGDKSGRGPDTKTMISFKVDHSLPGGLASALHAFEKQGLNLTSINSRPTKVIPFQYIFIIEFQGSLHKDTEGKVSAAIKGLEEAAQSYRWLGSWDNMMPATGQYIVLPLDGGRKKDQKLKLLDTLNSTSVMKTLKITSLFKYNRYARRRVFSSFPVDAAPPDTTRSYIQRLQNTLHEQLTKRPSNTIYDYVTPTPSHLLNVSLADHLPKECYPVSFSKLLNTGAKSVDLPNIESPLPLPQGHHIVYFPPQYREIDLLPDGTDTEHSPGGAFVRRLWAGGSIEFNDQIYQNPQTRMACIESISNVEVKGSTQGAEKVFVDIRRCIAPAQDIKSPRLIETRKLVFMREISMAKRTKERKGLKVSHKPDFSITLTPTPTLLFRFSALTFNAHRIHLDTQYSREVEDQKDMLVHGPLSLVLILSVLRSQLREGEMIARLDYKNISPLYVGAEMRICVRKNEKAPPNKLEVWIEDQAGCYAVKGSAIVGKWEEQIV